MSHCLYSCELREQLRNKESKVNKLKEVLDNLDDLEYFQPHCHQEVVTKKSNSQRNDRKHIVQGQTANCPYSTWVQKM